MKMTEEQGMNFETESLNELEDWAQSKERSGYEIKHDGDADWAIRRIRRAREDRDRLIMHYERQTEAAKAECERVEAYYSLLLRRYFETLPVKSTKTQASYKLPSGTLRLKRKAPAYKRDDAVLAKWMAEIGHAEWVKYEPQPAWSELKPGTVVNSEDVVYVETGEIIPGIKAVDRDDEFVIECRSGGDADE